MSFSLIYSKFSVAVALLILNVLVVFGSVNLRRKRSSLSSTLYDYVNCFATGIFLAITFLVLLPSARESLQGVSSDNCVKTGGHGILHLVEIIFLCGFTLNWLLSLISPTLSCIHDTLKKGTTHQHVPLLPRGSNCSASTDADEESDDSRHIVSLKQPAVTEHTNNSQKLDVMRILLSVIALGSHSLLEGVSLSFIGSTLNVIVMAFAIELHEVLCIGSFTLRVAGGISSETPKRRAIIFAILILYASFVPLGICCGLLAQRTAASDTGQARLIIGVIQALCASTVFFLVVSEFLPDQVGHSHEISTDFNYKRHILRSFARISLCTISMTLLAVINYFHHSYESEPHKSTNSNHTQIANNL